MRCIRCQHSNDRGLCIRVKADVQHIPHGNIRDIKQRRQDIFLRRMRRAGQQTEKGGGGKNMVQHTIPDFDPYQNSPAATCLHHTVSQAVPTVFASG